MEVKLLNAFILQLNTNIQLLALFKLILYSIFINNHKCSTLFYILQHYIPLKKK